MIYYIKNNKVLIYGEDIKRSWEEYFSVLFNEEFPWEKLYKVEWNSELTKGINENEVQSATNKMKSINVVGLNESLVM